MARPNQGLFDVDSDDDSINTTTTASSEANLAEQYEVEKVLCEDVNEEGQVVYLVKWEGYPLHLCTWEPTENIISPKILRDWTKEKLAIKRKEVQPFDVQQYYDAVENFIAEEDEKRSRRIAKRRKRGEVVRSTEEGELSESAHGVDVQPRSPKRPRTKVQQVKRKGVALPVTRKRSSIVRSGFDEDDIELDIDSSSSEEPISAQKKGQPEASSQSSTSKATNARPTAPKAVSAAAAAKLDPKTKPSGDTAAPAKEVEAVVKTVSSSTAAARKSVSATVPKTTAQKPAVASKVFGGDWTADKKKSRKRVRVSGETPKDSTERKFSHLSVQNRYQKYGQNEPAPDVNALTIVDPKTGKVEPPKTTQSWKESPASTRVGPSEMHSAYGRRTPPADTRAKSPSSPPVQQVQAANRGIVPLIGTNVNEASSTVQTTSTTPGFQSTHAKTTVCLRWQAGDCRYTADTCWFAHSDAPDKIVPRKATTCYFWKTTGSCRYPDDECQFAHFDTGVYAGEPGSFKRRNSSAPHIAAIKALGLQPMVGESSTGDAEVFNVASEPYVEPRLATRIAKEGEDVFRKIVIGDSTAATREVAQAVTSPPDEASTIKSHINDRPQPNFRNEVSTTETATTITSPAKDPRLRTQNTAFANSAIESPTMERIVPQFDRSIEADLEMAMRSVTSLDSSRLLKYGDGQIENVYIHMPPARVGELNLLRKFFTKFNCKVYFQPNDVDHWKYFSETFGKSCLLVFHPSENFIETIPGLHEYLVRRGDKARVFSIGVQHDQCIMEMRAPAYEARRLFPNGGITFITDDVFAYYPEKATEIINAFLQDNETKPPGAQSTKIGARPGVKDWLVRLAMSKFEEQGGEGECTDMRWVECYDALCKLCPMEDEDPDFPEHSVPLETSHLWSVWEDSLPSFKGRWESGDEEGATDYMANHFAGEACDKAWQYRKFFFVYQRLGMEEEVTDSQGASIMKSEVDPKGWMKKYCHIGVVTPEEALKTMRGGKKARAEA